MRTPFARPETTPQWLLGSVCWVAASWSSWLAVAWLGSWMAGQVEWLKGILIVGGLLAVQATIWLKAVPAAWRACSQATHNTWLTLPSMLWLLGLVGSHLYLLVIWLIGLLFAFGEPMQF